MGVFAWGRLRLIAFGAMARRDFLPLPLRAIPREQQSRSSAIFR